MCSSVESANKLVVEARLKGASMHWQRQNVNPMLALRNGVCNERWLETWRTSAANGKALGPLAPSSGHHRWPLPALLCLTNSLLPPQERQLRRPLLLACRQSLRPPCLAPAVLPRIIPGKKLLPVAQRLLQKCEGHPLSLMAPLLHLPRVLLVHIPGEIGSLMHSRLLQLGHGSDPEEFFG
jgi:hypothetical protein